MGGKRLIVLFAALVEIGLGSHNFALAELIQPPKKTSVFPQAQPIPCNEDIILTTEWDTAALKGCRNLKTLVTPGNARLLGFDKPEDVSNVRISKSFDVYTIGLDKLREYHPGDKVNNLIYNIESRLYPLSTEDKNAGDVVLSSLLISTNVRERNTQTFSGLGLKKLIRLVTSHNRTQPEFSFIVWIPSLNLHFLGDRRDEAMKLLPLATRKLYGLDEGKPVLASVVFALLAQQARAHDDNNPG